MEKNGVLGCCRQGKDSIDKDELQIVPEEISAVDTSCKFNQSYGKQNSFYFRVNCVCKICVIIGRLSLDGYKYHLNFNPEDKDLGKSGIRGVIIYYKVSLVVKLCLI